MFKRVKCTDDIDLKELSVQCKENKFFVKKMANLITDGHQDDDMIRMGQHKLRDYQVNNN